MKRVAFYLAATTASFIALDRSTLVQANAQVVAPEAIVRQAYPAELINEWNRYYGDASATVPKRSDFAVADLTGTGTNSIIVAAYSNGHSGVVRVLANGVAPPLVLHEVAGMEGDAPRVDLLDIDNDSFPEIVVRFSSNSNASAARIFRWTHGALTPLLPTLRTKDGIEVELLVSPDFRDVDGDGSLEIINNIPAATASPAPPLKLTGDALIAMKTDPHVSWSSPADIAAGTPLGSVQLNASASVPGTFAYTPAAGTVLSVGAAQTLSVTFTPTDLANYNVVSTTVRVNVIPPPQSGGGASTAPGDSVGGGDVGSGGSGGSGDGGGGGGIGTEPTVDPPADPPPAAGSPSGGVNCAELERAMRTASTPLNVPGLPCPLTAAVLGSAVSLEWSVPGSGEAPFTYVLEAGSSPGATDVGGFALGGLNAITVANVPNGTYFVRVRARNRDGVGPPSNEAIVIVGGAAPPCTGPPDSPANVSYTREGSTVMVVWSAPPGAVASFVIEAGLSPGAADVGVFETQAAQISANAPPGTYFVRIRARNACGTGNASREIAVVVP